MGKKRQRREEVLQVIKDHPGWTAIQLTEKGLLFQSDTDHLVRLESQFDIMYLRENHEDGRQKGWYFIGSPEQLRDAIGAEPAMGSERMPIRGQD